MENTKGVKLVKDGYEIHVKYSDESIKKKLVKFVVTGDNKEIVLSADEIISTLVGQVNSEVLSAAFVESDRVNVVEVARQLQVVLDKDYPKGSVINLNYTHPYPIEFALIEEVWKIAKIKGDTKVTELTAEYIEKVKLQIKSEMVDYASKFYKSFKSINLENKKRMEPEIKNEEAEVVAETVAEETPAVEEAAPVAEEAVAEETPAPVIVEEGALPPSVEALENRQKAIPEAE